MTGALSPLEVRLVEDKVELLAVRGMEAGSEKAEIVRAYGTSTKRVVRECILSGSEKVIESNLRYFHKLFDEENGRDSLSLSLSKVRRISPVVSRHLQNEGAMYLSPI